MQLEVKDLSKSYGKLKALINVSFSMTEGVYGILGPNGAGKSTLINLLTDNIKRESGQIYVNGVEIAQMKSEYLNYIGYMPQEQGYYEEFTVRAFLMYVARLKGLKGKFIKENTDELICKFNLGNFCNKKIGSLSGGMRQRVLLAQSLLNNPKILILDEPTAGVDPQERINIRNIISKMAENRIIIIATHIVSDIEAIAKEIILINKGNIIKMDSPYRLMKEVESKLVEMEVNKTELEEIQSQYIVSNIQYGNNNYYVKFLCDNADIYKGHNIRANLEDVYLYYYGDVKMDKNSP